MTTDLAGCIILARPELGAVTQAERRGDMAVVHTACGVTYICNVAGPSRWDRVEMPSDCETNYP